MADESEFDPTDSLAVGTIGPAGKRAFYLQATSGPRRLTLLVEKVQVRALAERAIELLQGLAVGPTEEPVALREPIEHDWRAGDLGLGLDEERGMMVLVAEELDESDEGGREDLARALFWLRPAQMLALAVHGLDLCRAGRPLCAMCGLPIDPEGHICPRKNGKSPIF